MNIGSVRKLQSFGRLRGRRSACTAVILHLKVSIPFCSLLFKVANERRAGIVLRRSFAYLEWRNFYAFEKWNDLYALRKVHDKTPKWHLQPVPAAQLYQAV